MIVAPVYDGTVQAYERAMGPGPCHAHIEDPGKPGWSLCLVRLTGQRTTGGDCPECAEWVMRNRAWVAR